MSSGPFAVVKHKLGPELRGAWVPLEKRYGKSYQVREPAARGSKSWRVECAYRGLIPDISAQEHIDRPSTGQND